MAYPVSVSAKKSRTAVRNSIMITIHVSASVEIHQPAITHTPMIHTLASVSVSLMNVRHISTSIQTFAVVAVMNILLAPTTSTSTNHLVNVSAVTSRNVVQPSTMTMTVAAANVRNTRHVQIINITTAHPVLVNASLWRSVMMANTLTTTHASANVVIRQNAMTTISTIHIHASVSANLMTVPKHTISITISASVCASTTHMSGVSKTTNTTMRPVAVHVRKHALHHMSWTQTSVSVCATKSVRLDTY